MFDRKSFLITVLATSALAMIVGHVELSQTARADVEVSDDDYQLVTSITYSGDDGLFILNKQKNMVAFFTWDSSRRAIVPRDVRSLDGVLAGR